MILHDYEVEMLKKRYQGFQGRIVDTEDFNNLLDTIEYKDKHINRLCEAMKHNIEYGLYTGKSITAMNSINGTYIFDGEKLNKVD